MQKHIKQLKDVEKFALRMATKSWDSGYQDLLALTDIIALEPRRAQASLCMLFKIVHGLCFFPLQCDNHKAKSQSAYKQASTAPIQLLLIHAFQEVVAPCFCELGPHKSRKNNGISTTKQRIYTNRENLHIPVISIS